MFVVDSSRTESRKVKLFIAGVIIRVNQVYAWVFREKADLALELVGNANIIRVQETDVFTVHLAQGGVARSRWPGIFLREDSYPRIVRGLLL